MADPLSVTGSAVGVVSLGLEVFKGLTSFISKYRSSDKEINDILSKIDSLRCILESLSSTLTDADGLKAPPLSSKFESALRTIESCNERIRQLEKFLGKLQRSPVSRTSQKLKETMNRALYALQGDNPVDLLSTVNGLQENLNTSLLHLQM